MVARKGEADDRPEVALEEGGFLGRWSRRKAEAKAVEETPSAVSADLREAEALGDLAAADAGPVTDETGEPPEFDVASLPDIDSLGPGSDFSMFMQAGVPKELKTKALRKLWRVKADLANLDGLIDYGEDLTGSFKTVAHLKTAYEVGRGFLRDRDNAAENAGEQAEDASDRPMTTSERPVDQQPIADEADDAEPNAEDGGQKANN
ncbi:MAG: DUF3306 domain-containing protein [Pseudomonadota bacterium]